MRASGDLLMLGRPAEAITSVVEAATWTLDPTDYQLRPSGTILHRLRTGLNPSVHWRGRVEVVYVPADDAARRGIAQVELCRVSIAFNPGLASQTIGQWTEAYQTGGATPEELRSAAVLPLLDPAGVW